MPYKTRVACLGAAAAMLCALTISTYAAELKLLASAGVRGPLAELTRMFEATSQHSAAASYEVTAVLKRRIDAGEEFDLTILNPEPIDDLIRTGVIAADTRTNLGRTGLAVAVRKGASKPDINTTESFKRTMLNARSVAHSKEGLSGVGFLRALMRLGIAEEMRPKLMAYDTDGSLPALARGEAELAVIAIGPILEARDVEPVGMLPAEIQTYVYFTGGVRAVAKEPDAARSLIRFLSAPAAIPIMKSKGLEPF
jgi:molybdate transport system substrate-binding protein